MFNARYKPTIITAQPDICDLRQEFNDNGMHRIAHSDGTATPFVPYRDFAYYGGYVSVTAFWADEGLYSVADFALVVATALAVTPQQVQDFEAGTGRVFMRDVVDTPVAVSVANSPKDYTKKPKDYTKKPVSHVVEDGVSGDADLEFWENAAATPVTRH